ncbi:hypothetical protein [Cyanobacterium sp. Dongsha4]|nr:hypothetical protein [Cyanobacterium sp. Dongsha4]WVL02102.1 hypothetical protein Dongsha4_07910 [Cyanobacterium sp. Dongsha4]
MNNTRQKFFEKARKSLEVAKQINLDRIPRTSHDWQTIASALSVSASI